MGQFKNGKVDYFLILATVITLSLTLYALILNAEFLGT